MPRVLWSGYSYPTLISSLKSMGWEIRNRLVLDWYPWAHGNVAEIPAGTPREFTRHVEKELDAGFKPDLFVIGKGCDSNVPVVGFTPSYWHIEKRLLQRLKNDGCKIMLLTLDDPNDCGFTIHAFDMELVDFVGTCCIGTSGVYHHYGRPKVFEFWPAWDNTWSNNLKIEKVCDFLVVGTPYTKGGGSIMGPSISRRDIVLEAMRMGVNVHVYGPENWLYEEHGGHPEIAPAYKGVASGHQWEEIFKGAKIVYNSFVRQGYRYLNDRVPIVGGYGSFLLMENQEGLQDDLVSGEHCGYHDLESIESFVKELRYWLDNDEKREACAKNMQARIFGSETFTHRAQLLNRIWNGSDV